MTPPPLSIPGMARIVLATRCFSDFLPFVTLRSDNPMRPAATLMEPYAYQVERAQAWQRGDSEIVLKARQLGFSSGLISPYSLFRAMWSGWSVGYWSLNEKAAVRQLESRVLYCWERLPAPLRRPYRRNDTLIEFEGGGSIQVFPATQIAGTGETFQLVVFDEAAFHAYGADNWSQVQPTISAGGQALIISTASPKLGPAGWFYSMWQAAQQGEADLTPVFVPWHARDGRDAAWLARQRRLHVGLPEAFDAQYPETPGAAFVGRSGLVYPQFSAERHVRALADVPWERCQYRYVGYDLGGGDPTAIIMLGIYRRGDGLLRAHQYGEWIQTAGAPSVEDMYAAMAPWHARAPLTGIEADSVPGGAVIAQSLRNLFGGAVPVRVETQGRGEGLGLVGSWLDNGWLTIAPECPWSVKEFPGYRWLERTDPNSQERYATRTPHDNHADCMDARRRALTGAYNALMSARDRVDMYDEVRL